MSGAPFESLVVGLVRSRVRYPKGTVRWDALNAGLSVAEQEKYRVLCELCGIKLNFFPTATTSPQGRGTEGMYVARRSVQEHSRALLDPNAILLWLDADLLFSLSRGTARGTEEFHADRWLDKVWRYAAEHPEVDVATGDVLGNPPVPASSTIRTNLVDLAGYVGGKTARCDLQRWEERDASYDLSEHRTTVGRPFAMPTEGAFASCPKSIIDRLLWSGTLARPIVSNEQVAHSPHRPKWVRGGVTVVFNQKVMTQDYIGLEFDGWSLRRGDSFWMLKGCERGWKVRHFPHPLLHKRGMFPGDSRDLVQSFINRGVEDYLGAAALKATASFIDAKPLKYRYQFLFWKLREALTTRKEKSQQLLEESLETLSLLETVPGIHLVRQAIEGLRSELARINPEAGAVALAPQIRQYLKLEDQQMTNPLKKSWRAANG